MTREEGHSDAVESPVFPVAGLLSLGVISSDAVAEGTPALGAEEAARFDAAFEALRAEIEAKLPERWRSDPAEAAEP